MKTQRRWSPSRPVSTRPTTRTRGAPAALPGLLDRIDAWIADGVLNGEELNAADFQIAPSLALAMTLDDLRPAIENRPASDLARRVAPNYPGKTPPILPPAWLQQLRDATATA